MRKSIRSLVAVFTVLGASFAAPAPAQQAAAEAAATPARVAQAPVTPSSATVMLDGKPLLRLATIPEILSAKQRADETSARILALASRERREPVEVKVVRQGRNVALVSGDTYIVALFPQDAALEGITLDALAERDAKALQQAIAGFRHARSARTIAERAGFMVLAWLLYYLLVRAVIAVSRSFRARLRIWRQRSLVQKGIRGLGSKLADQVALFLVAVARLVLTLLLFALFLTLVTLTLRVFPQTGRLADSVLESERGAAVKAMLAVVDYLPSFVFLVIIVAFSWYLVRGLRMLFDAVERGDITLGGFYAEWAAPTYSIARFLVIVFAAVVAFPHLPGGQSDAFKGVSLFLGVLLSLGSTSAVSNVVSGVILTYMHPFKLGDFVEIGGTVGTVVKRNFLVTRIRTIKNEEVTIPNGAVLGGQMRNYSAMAQDRGLIVHTSITIGYDAPWRRVHELMIAAARATDGVVDSPSPFVWQTSLNDYHVSYQINAFTRSPHELFRIQAELHRNIQDAFNEAGVEIMSPAFAALRDGNTVTIPREHRPEGHEAPGFRVERGREET